MVRSSFAHCNVRSSYNSRSFLPRVTKFGRDIVTDLATAVPDITRYDVAGCFQSAANWVSVLARIAKIVPQAVSYKQLI